MIVCICHRVSDRDIARAAQQGCASFEELQADLLVSTACGKCRDCARETFHRHAMAAPAAGQGAGADVGVGIGLLMHPATSATGRFPAPPHQPA